MAQSGLTNLVGRTAELEAFDAALTDLGAERGGSILVEGEPGIGKSALVEAGLAAARSRGFRVVHAACDELESRFPLAVMSRALKTDAGPSAVPEAAGPGRDALVLAEDPVVVEAERLLGVVDRWCAAGPVVVALDDLQWADDASLLLWRRLCRTASQLPLVTVGAARLVPLREELAGLRRDLRKRGGRVLGLEPLAGSEVTELAQRRTGGRPGPLLAGRLNTTAGNPLYVNELLDVLKRAERLTVSGGVAEIAESQDAEVAASLAGVISDRLGFLSPDCRAALRTAALLGPDFSAADLSTAADRAAMETAGLLEEAITAGVLEPVGARLRFRHGLIRHALFTAMPEALRDLLQRNAARSLSAAGAPVERVAQMLLALAGPADGWESDWLVEHAGVLLGRAPVVAADLFERALEHTRGNDPRAEVLRDHLAVAALFLRRMEVAERLAREVLGSSSDAERRSQARWNLGLIVGKQFDEASVLIDEALADPRTTRVWQARFVALRARILLWAGRFAEALEAADRAARLGEEQSDAMAIGHALFSAGILHSRLGDRAQAISVSEHALAAIGTDPRLVGLQRALLGNLSAMLAGGDRHSEAIRLLADAGKQAERLGTHAAAMMQMHAATIAFAVGRWDEAVSDFESVLEQGLIAQEGPHAAVSLHGMSSLIALHRDEAEVLATHLGAVEDASLADPHALFNSVHYTCAKALAADRAGRVDAAVELLSAVHESERGQVEDRELVFPALIEFALRAGNRELARAVASTCDQDAKELPGARKQAFADWCRGLVHADPGPISNAADYFRATDRLLELGNAMEDLAVLAAVAGRSEEARGALAEAMSQYTRLGAVWDSRRAVARLRKAGLSVGVRGPRRRPSTGWGALTETERRVAEFVAEGDSNTDIAERMVLSRRTVEVHVSHVLSKLQVRSRREVAALKAR